MPIAPVAFGIYGPSGAFNNRVVLAFATKQDGDAFARTLDESGDGLLVVATELREVVFRGHVDLLDAPIDRPKFWLEFSTQPCRR